MIRGLYGGTVSVSASGSNLGSPVMAKLTVNSDPYLHIGTAKSERVIIDVFRNEFEESFENPTTQAACECSGVLLPKSRSGGGLFRSQGLRARSRSSISYSVADLTKATMPDTTRLTPMPRTRKPRILLNASIPLRPNLLTMGSPRSRQT